MFGDSIKVKVVAHWILFSSFLSLSSYRIHESPELTQICLYFASKDPDVLVIL